jgi:hypothetical protein
MKATINRLFESHLLITNYSFDIALAPISVELFNVNTEFGSRVKIVVHLPVDIMLRINNSSLVTLAK